MWPNNSVRDYGANSPKFDFHPGQISQTTGSRNDGTVSKYKYDSPYCHCTQYE